MQEKKKRNRILMLLIAGMLLIYAFTDTENVKISRGRSVFFSSASQNVLKQAANWLLPGLTYVKEGRKDTLTGRIEKSVLSFVPISEYVRNHEEPETTVEDTLTRTMILENQANDENAIDENGNLIPAGSMQESVGAGVPEENAAVLASTPVQEIDMKQLNDYEYLVGTFYTVDGTTMTGPEELNAGKFLEKNLALDMTTGGPKVLIYHTHSQEAFADSVDGDASTTIMGIGTYLTELLNARGIETLHHEGIYDLIDGKLDRSRAYQLAEPDIRQILKDNPSIEVVIDLHRDGVAQGTHLVTEINGKPTAQIMFFNGLSRTRKNGEIAYLNNPYREDNLATSFQMQLMAARYYPGFTRHIYLKSYRYNLDLAPKAMLIEAGAQTNTVEEMKNAMEVLADVLSRVLTP